MYRVETPLECFSKMNTYLKILHDACKQSLGYDNTDKISKSKKIIEIKYDIFKYKVDKYKNNNYNKNIASVKSNFV